MISWLKSPAWLSRLRRTGPPRRGGPAHTSAAPEPPASTSVGLLGSTTVAMPRTDGLVARSTVSIVNSRRLVSRKVGCGAAAALAGHAGIAHNHDGLGVKVSVGWSDEGATRLRATVTAAAIVTAWVCVRIRRRLSRVSPSRSVDLASWLRDHVHPSYMWPDPLHVASCSRSTETWPWQVPVGISCDFTESFQYMIS